jgi:hypothetical protein
MSDDRPSARAVATGVGGFLIAVILLNVLLRLAPLPDVDVPAVGLPDFPAWMDTAADAIHTILKVKNWLIVGVVAVLVAGPALEQLAKRRDGGRPDA